MKRIFTLSIVLLGLAYASSAQTNVPASITSDQTWNLAGSPYLISQNTFVDSGVTLTVLPGTIIKGSNFGLYINGSIDAKGNSSSKIIIDSLTIRFSAKSTDYDPVTKKGCQFRYCVFPYNNFSYLTTRIISDNADISVTNSEFYTSRFGISTNASLMIDSCLFNFFDNTNKTRGYPINTGGNPVIKVTNSHFEGFVKLELQGKLHFKNNVFRNYDFFQFTFTSKSEILCNKFTNSYNAINLTVNPANDPSAGVNFSNNTIDSVGNGVIQNMIRFHKNINNDSSVNSTFNGNNFLTQTQGIVKVRIWGANSNVLTSKIIDFKSNYWGTTDSATIENYVQDYSDYNTSFAKADISNFATSQITPVCNSKTTKPCNAKFSVTVDTAGVATFIDSSTAANAYTRTWLYGDGSNGGHSFKKHLYNPGTYNACLAIVDNVTGCRDTFCTSIKVRGKSTCEASYFFGIDTSNKFTVYLINDSKGVTTTTQFLWDFGDGTTSTLRKPTHTYSQFKKYFLCLTLTDSAKNCYSTYCDSVGQDSLGNFFLGPGINMVVIDEKDLTSTIEANKLQVNIYPNPSRGKVYFSLGEEFKEGATVTVLNPIGKAILSEKHYKNGSIDLKGLPNGMYFIQIQTKNKSGVSRVLLSK